MYKNIVRKAFTYVLFFGLTIPLCALAVFDVLEVGNKDKPVLLDTQLQKALEDYLTQNKATEHISAVQLSVLLPGESQPRNFVVGTKSYGDLKPATTDMLMQWGSITKVYTDALIFKLSDNDRQFSTLETLGQLFPERFNQTTTVSQWPQAWAGVNLIQLMNMTSGIPDYQPILAAEVADKTNKFDPHKVYSLDEMIDIAADYQTQKSCRASLIYGCFDVPGSAYFYSNTNYIILGLVIEKFGKTSLTAAFNKMLLPFQNENMQVYYYADQYPQNIFNQMIHGYYQSSPGVFEDVTDWNMSFAASAGAMLGDARSLVEMTQALYQSRIVPIQELTGNAVEIATGNPVVDPEKQCGESGEGCFGMGTAFAYEPDQGGMVYFYIGSPAGYMSDYNWIPSENLILAVSQNAKADTMALQGFLANVNQIIRPYLKAR